MQDTTPPTPAQLIARARALIPVLAERAAAAEAARRTKLWSAYQSELYEALERFKMDPRSHQAGEVLLDITIAPSGQLLASSILKSSGVPELDRAALASLKRTHFPPIPSNVSAGSYRVTVPFQYNMH